MQRLVVGGDCGNAFHCDVDALAPCQTINLVGKHDSIIDRQTPNHFENGTNRFAHTSNVMTYGDERQRPN